VHRDLSRDICSWPRTAAASGGGHGLGLAKERRADPAIAKLTATGIILGTPEFIEPEQIRGKAARRPLDIYALGIVAFEMFTASWPSRGGTPRR